ncbi:hypothetical protein EES39_38765 [Streptomyces sp. ADI92-24]|uniref:hypothetical protein n=1 Tax=Streptomyces sp. ADI92-24 TaxID=1522756 RepID=UPI000F556BCA|nr:hypothetical protein [Streptomyces sp. ADI92-24]RPK32433.1 hypothetical protein EES39_38765 [Streptomyces sp. ADI92-24]
MDRLIAPYVIAWTDESTPPARVVVTPAGVSYADPVQDALARDFDNVLWELCAGTATGSPAYAAELHPGRQPECMESLLCANCRNPAARDEGGMTWVLPAPEDGLPPATRWEGARTEIPPMCASCARSVPRRCPRLREGYMELRVREAEQIGVRGTLHPRTGEPGLRPEERALVLYDSPDLPFVVARQVVRELRQITVVAFNAVPT